VTWWRSLAVLLCVLTTLVFPRSASASSGLGRENRVKGFLLVAPTLVGGSHDASLGKHLGKSNAYDENASGSCLAAEGVTNEIPTEMARVVPADFAGTATLGAPTASEAWVTAASDIEGITSSTELAERLTLVDSSGQVITGARAVITFDTVTEGLASPVARGAPGFVGGGITAGGAREFVMPNLPVNSLPNAAAVAEARPFQPGPFAGESIPTKSSAQTFTAEERESINEIMGDTGCRTCALGTRADGGHLLESCHRVTYGFFQNVITVTDSSAPTWQRVVAGVGIAGAVIPVAGAELGELSAVAGEISETVAEADEVLTTAEEVQATGSASRPGRWLQHRRAKNRSKRSESEIGYERATMTGAGRRASPQRPGETFTCACRTPTAAGT
jgi:hypothetical protein